MNFNEQAMINYFYKSKRLLIIILCSFFLILLFSSATNMAEANNQTVIKYVSSYPCDPNIVLHFSMQEGYGQMAFDNSGYENHGVLLGKSNADWISNGGIHFNGDSGILVNASTSLQLIEKTIAIKFLWGGNATDSELYLYDDGWSDDGSLIIYVHPSTSRLYAEFITKNGTQKNIWQSIIPNVEYIAIFTFNGLNYSLSLNGAVKTGYLSQNEELKISASIVFGSDFSIKRRFFTGDIFSIEVLNKWMSSTELEKLYKTFLRNSNSTMRYNFFSDYIFSGWITDFSNLSSQKPLTQIYVNRSVVATTDEYGFFSFTINFTEIGNFICEFSADGLLNSIFIEIVVDQIKTVDFGSINADVGNEGVFWVKLASVFDNEPVESGVVILSNGLNATWNSNLQRWEYKTVRNSSGNLTLGIECVFWDKYCLSSFDFSNSEDVTISWKGFLNIPLVLWISGIGPALFGIFGLLLLLFIFIRFKIIKLADKSVSSFE